MNNLRIDEAIRRVADEEIERAVLNIKSPKQKIEITKVGHMISIEYYCDNIVQETHVLIIDGWQAEEKPMSFMEAWEWMLGKPYKNKCKVFHNTVRVNEYGGLQTEVGDEWMYCKPDFNDIREGEFYKASKEGN